MVTIHGGGTSYAVTGKVMPWEDVPQAFKEEVVVQQTYQQNQCLRAREDAEKCMVDHGFWNEKCVALREAFELCVGIGLKQQLAVSKRTPE